MKPPHRDLIAGIVDRQLLDRSDWDLPHEFITLHWDGSEITFGMVVAIDTTIHPGRYPDLMMKVAQEVITEQRKRPEPVTLYGFLLTFEAHAVAEPPATAPVAEQEQFQRDRLRQTFHQRPDAVEIASVWCADIHHRMWTATRRRNRPQDIERRFYIDTTAPGGNVPGGRFSAGLLAVAEGAAIALYGAPMPQPGTTRKWR